MEKLQKKEGMARPLANHIENSNEKRYDMWRDGPLRYLGYANEVGEAFRLPYPRMVVPSYAISIGYVLVDTLDKASLATKNSSKDQNGDSGQIKEVLTAAVDTLVWQGLASVILPGITINQVVKATQRLVVENKSG
ncbi:unnamed protein product, partial [Heterosigma akashiwo]